MDDEWMNGFVLCLLASICFHLLYYLRLTCLLSKPGSYSTSGGGQEGVLVERMEWEGWGQPRVSVFGFFFSVVSIERGPNSDVLSLFYSAQHRASSTLEWSSFVRSFVLDRLRRGSSFRDEVRYRNGSAFKACVSMISDCRHVRFRGLSL